MKKVDILLLFILIVPSLFFIFLLYGKHIGSTASVYVDGEIIGNYSLSENRDIIVEGLNGISDTLRIRDNAICMIDAKCSDAVCIKQGWISKQGESICCAPAGIFVVINSDEKVEYDAITQ